MHQASAPQTSGRWHPRQPRRLAGIDGRVRSAATSGAASAFDALRSPPHRATNAYPSHERRAAPR